MAFFLGVIVIICAFIIFAAGMAVAIAAALWLRWRIALVPFFRLSEKVKVWYKREQRKDWCTRCGQRLVFGLLFLLMQIPLYFIVEEKQYHLRTVTLVIAGVLFIRGVWGHMLGGEARRRILIADTARVAHEAFDEVTPTIGAQAREYVMNIFTAERVVRWGVYTVLVASFLAALAWDGGAHSALGDLVLR